ncbi:MAG: Holliday junction ATP-dependent DNA helicase RuvB [Candidatus Uhrbacteria bacterium GW2011_GWF2_41_16]|uniref:Holliday junction branch migration complex subunit RuvB n=2 Tax=Candidatus Uhriibacteriota TaxID=1752732 RepID=A0A0G0YBR6_9BACT|nr:MAG: Holliday junction ATP-dependent DNA helicase RuvB [Candidatus Uhrbacteria bacterium GW2011_GWC2_41_11]KKR97762.1 MAG: Holliday junction ATP-dependent DNA helicase RuvB [Candidatus Uhrbacteria bacterium GW2011_GWF2_41_16]HBO99771.1 Holliday junction branch migration DNA helicase RuvB [Candidatus Uhrbacteria bacterium]
MIERDDSIPEKKSVIGQTTEPEEQTFEIGLRPQTLEDFVGQQALKDNLHIVIQAAKGREEPLEHVLFYGNPGLGKTTLAHIIAKEMGAQMRVTSGPALERVGDLAAILSNLGHGDVLFIDEIHRMNKTIEEVLYPAMEDQVLDLIVGKGPTARTLRLTLERFTIIGATTRLSLLSSPLRDRFGMTYHLSFYEEGDMARIVERSANRLNVPMDKEAVYELAKRCRRTPRIANRLLRRVRDFAEVKGDGHISQTLALEALRLLEIDPSGLDQIDRQILETIIHKFSGGPVGVGTIAAATQEEVETIETVYEPFLIQLGLLHRTPRGRVVTPRAYEHLGLSVPLSQLPLS